MELFPVTAEALLGIAVGFGLAAAAGFRVFVPLLAAAIAAKKAFPGRASVAVTGEAGLGYMLGNLEVLLREKPDVVLVQGDTTTAMTAALAGFYAGVKVAHVEAGLRSGDRRMPEEINRVLTDQIADRLYTTERAAEAHLRREGIAAERVCFVGNVMIDSLQDSRPQARSAADTLRAHGLDAELLAAREDVAPRFHRASGEAEDLEAVSGARTLV